MNLDFVILAAGMGTRLGHERPKSLTVLQNGETIMARQIRNIRAAFGKKAQITIVVGYRLEDIIEEFPDENFVYNEAYDMTNTSKSLLRALRSLPKENGVVWMNGDVVFDDRMLPLLKESIEISNESTIVTTSESVAEEEVKYTVDSSGYINKLSKQVNLDLALGEAVGINYVTAADRPVLESQLKRVDNNDYFEKGIEVAISENGSRYIPFDITLLGLLATEVDFQEDLSRANSNLALMTE